MDFQLLSEIFPISHYQDDFGYSKEWNEEVRRWLSFADSLDSQWYGSNIGRVGKEKQRDEFLGECKALYYIGVKLGCKIIRMEPPGRNERKLDFTFEDATSIAWNVEVKSPSWRLVESERIDAQFPQQSESQRAELKRKRWTQPQYINGKGGSISAKDAIEHSLRKAAKQFAEGENNLLIITPNMVEGDLAIALCKTFGGSLVRDCIARNDKEGVISCVCLLDVKLYLGSSELNYNAGFVEITHSPKLA